MGWLYSHASRDALITSLIQTQESDQFRRETLKHTLRGNVLWSVIRITAKLNTQLLLPGQSINLISCDLLRQVDRQWGYKSLCEDEWPCYYTCPLSYLEMAPVRSEGWRECVIAYHQSRRAQA
ncbi:TPA: hypothetical protein OMU28_004023 [Klebsiella aerogenes]|nr:hypothetical protein [Klebsiella aerogenes]